MNALRREAFVNYAKRARAKQTFETEEVKYRLEAASGLRDVLELAGNGEPWLAELDKVFRAQFAGRPFDLLPGVHIAWLKHVAGTDEVTLGRELRGFLDPEADPVKEFQRFEHAVERARSAADIAAQPPTVVNVGSLFAFAGAPLQRPALVPELFQELHHALGSEWLEEASPTKRYQQLCSFVNELSVSLPEAGVPVEGVIETESVLTTAARELDFWAGTPDQPARAAKARRPGPYLSVCAIYRDEAPYLAEWIEFHKLVGVDRFFLYNNLSEDDHLQVLAPYIADGSVAVHDWPVFPGQVYAYVDCLRWHRNDSRWIAFIDVDEFLFSPTGEKVSTLLLEYEQYPGVAVNWAVYGSSGHRAKPEGLVIENFVHRLDMPLNRVIKSIVDPTRVIRPVDPHYFRYPYLGAVDENHYPVGERPMTVSVSFERLRINHYYSKSEEELVAKYKRARAGGNPRLLGNIEERLAADERASQLDQVLLPYVPKVRSALTRGSSQAAQTSLDRRDR